MNKKINLLIAIIAIAIVGGGAFFGGMIYEKNLNSGGTRNGNFANLTPEQRQARVQQLNGNSANTRGGNFINGEIIGKDDKSITVKMTDGSSKIIFYSGSTQVMKNDVGTSDDLAIGKQVMANGTANNDGSISAQSIQLRPENAIAPTK